MIVSQDFLKEFDTSKKFELKESACKGCLCWGRVFKRKSNSQNSCGPLVRSRAMEDVRIAHNPVFNSEKDKNET